MEERVEKTIFSLNAFQCLYTKRLSTNEAIHKSFSKYIKYSEVNTPFMGYINESIYERLGVIMMQTIFSHTRIKQKKKKKKKKKKITSTAGYPKQ